MKTEQGMEKVKRYRVYKGRAIIREVPKNGKLKPYQRLIQEADEIYFAADYVHLEILTRKLVDTLKEARGEFGVTMGIRQRIDAVLCEVLEAGVEI
jgi:hypothetical protein